jgi:hypothetical protein
MTIPTGRKTQQHSNRSIDLTDVLERERKRERYGTDLEGEAAYFNVSLIAKRIMQIVLGNSRRH